MLFFKASKYTTLLACISYKEIPVEALFLRKNLSDINCTLLNQRINLYQTGFTFQKCKKGFEPK